MLNLMRPLTFYPRPLIWNATYLSKHLFLRNHWARASDYFQGWWAEVTHKAENGGSFSEMMGPSISN